MESYGNLSLKQTSNKRDRLTLKTEFSAVRDNAQKQVSSLAVMLYAEPEPIDIQARCGVICSKRFDKRAVYRNRARRLLYEAFRMIGQELRPCRIIFIPRRPILKVKMQDVAQDLNRLCCKAKLIQNSPKSN